MVDTDTYNTAESSSENLGEDSSNIMICKFRFVSGSYIGCSLDLHPEDYFIGNTEDCDVVCGDNEQETEARLTITQDCNVFVTLLKGQISVNSNKLVQDEVTELPEGSVLALGFDSLVWMSDWSKFSDNWTIMSQSQLEQLKSEAEKSHIELETNNSETQEDTSEVKEETETNSSENSQENNENNNETVNTDDTSGNEVEQTSKDNKGKSRKIPILIGVLVLAVLVFFMNWGYLLELGSSTSKEKISLKEYVKKYPQGKLDLLESEYLAVVRGVLPDQESLNNFIKDLPETMDKPLELNIKLISDLQLSLNKSFLSYGISVSSVYTNDGFEVYGYIHDSLLEADIVNKVEKDFADFAHIIPKMTYSINIQPVMDEYLSKYGLKTDYKFGKGIIAYNGNFSLASLEKLQKLKKDVMNFVNGPVIFIPYDRVPKDEERYISSNDANQKDKATVAPVVLPFEQQNVQNILSTNKPTNFDETSMSSFTIKDITGISLGTINFFTSKSGIKYFVGGKLPDGSIVKKIEKNCITVEKENNLKKICN